MYAERQQLTREPCRPDAETPMAAFEAVFDRLDSDESRGITQEEFVKYFSRAENRAAVAAAAALSPP